MTALTARQLIAALDNFGDHTLDRPVHLDARTTGSTTASAVVELANDSSTASAVVLGGDTTTRLGPEAPA